MSTIICTMPECQTTAGCLCRLTGIVTDASYIAPFVPSLADDYYSKVISQQDAELDRLRRELEEAKEFRAILEGHLSAAIDDYNEARKAAFIEAAEIAEQTIVPNSSGAALGANLRAERIAGALRAKAEETDR